MKQELRRKLGDAQRDFIRALETQRVPFLELCDQHGVGWEQLCRWLQHKCFRRAVEGPMRAARQYRRMVLASAANLACDKLHELVRDAAGTPEEVHKISVYRTGLASNLEVEESDDRRALLAARTALSGGARRRAASSAVTPEEENLFHPSVRDDGPGDEARLRRLEAPDRPPDPTPHPGASLSRATAAPRIPPAASAVPPFPAPPQEPVHPSAVAPGRCGADPAEDGDDYML